MPNHAGVVSTWDLCDVELTVCPTHFGEIFWDISKNKCGENEKSEKVAMMHSMLSDSSSSRGIFHRFYRAPDSQLRTYSLSLALSWWSFSHIPNRRYKILKSIEEWRLMMMMERVEEVSSSSASNNTQLQRRRPENVGRKVEALRRLDWCEYKEKERKNLRSFYRRLRCRRVRLCASRDKWDDLCNQHNIYPRDEKSITLEPSRVDSSGCCCCCVCVFESAASVWVLVARVRCTNRLDTSNI